MGFNELVFYLQVQIYRMIYEQTNIIFHKQILLIVKKFNPIKMHLLKTNNEHTTQIIYKLYFQKKHFLFHIKT